jgi:hypothetical protein
VTRPFTADSSGTAVLAQNIFALATIIPFWEKAASTQVTIICEVVIRFHAVCLPKLLLTSTDIFAGAGRRTPISGLRSTTGSLLLSVREGAGGLQPASEPCLPGLCRTEDCRAWAVAVNGELTINRGQLILEPLHVPLKPHYVPAALDGTEQGVALELQARTIFHGRDPGADEFSAHRLTSRFNNSPHRCAFLSISRTGRFRWL